MPARFMQEVAFTSPATQSCIRVRSWRPRPALCPTLQSSRATGLGICRRALRACAEHSHESPESALARTNGETRDIVHDRQELQRAFLGSNDERIASEDEDGDLLYDHLVSDDEYIVVDGKDVGKLIDELRSQGLDDLGSAVDDFDRREDMRLSFENSQRAAQVQTGTHPITRDPGGYLSDEKDENQEPVMKYFTRENMSFMPKWARDAYEQGNHHEIELGARRFGQDRGARRLDVMVSADRMRSKSEQEDAIRRDAQSSNPDEGDMDDESSSSKDAKENSSGNRPDIIPRASSVIDTIDNEWDGTGIFDCALHDVAVDYNIPVEFVVDIMLSFDVRPPIRPSDGIRDRLTTEEIEKMLLLITSFDAMDLADRYSDKTIAELAEDYDIDVTDLIETCNSEGIYLPFDENTRLQLSREDRIIDIIRGVGTPGQEYPSLLEGLVGNSGM